MSVDTTNATASVDPTRAKIAGSIRQAASTTGASFEYLLATAKMESNFNPKAAATTSSARGLFQFIDQTWLGGQSAVYIKAQLQAFAAGTRRNDISQQMRNIARQMTAEEIDQVASYYEAQP